MFKKSLLLLLPLMVTSCGEKSKSSGKVVMDDPNNVLFSLPTLCDPMPEPDIKAAPEGSRGLHEDDWRQIEFVVRANQAYIEQELQNLTAFKRKNYSEPGWTEVYVRKEHPTPFAAVGLKSGRLPGVVSAGLTIGNAPPRGGAVKGGFTVGDEGGWFLYGEQNDDGLVVQLAVSHGQSGPSEKFAQALSEFAQRENLLLVDWYAVSIVDTSSSESVLKWAERYRQKRE